MNWCLDQLSIKSYQHSRKSGYFKIVARFTQAHVKLTIIKKDKFIYLLENESTNHKTKNLDDYDSIVDIFGINAKINDDKKRQVIKDIGQLIREIGMFYN